MGRLIHFYTNDEDYELYKNLTKGYRDMIKSKIRELFKKEVKKGEVK